MRLALYQPDIPPNTGTLLRLGACLGVAVDIIEPCGFAFSERALKRSAMDYLSLAEAKRHLDWQHFNAWRQECGYRLIGVETGSTITHIDFHYEKKDILLLGQESVGLPAEVLACCAAVVSIPMRQNIRSLNVAIAAAMVLSEALRQTEGYPQ
jgi:tRNA (cytidine/uridine-2'-O-)-methyltransferase